MKVAVVAECFLPEMNGVTGSVLRVLDHLRDRGHDAVLIAPGPGDDDHDGVPVVRVRSVPLPCYRSLRVGLPVPAVRRALRAFGPDVVHVAAPAILGAHALRVAHDEGVPAVAVYQTDLVGFARRYDLGALAGTMRRALRTIHEPAALTLAPSTAAAWQLRAAGVERIARWGRGVDLDRFHPDRRDDALRRRIAPRGEVVVGAVGRLAAEKRLELLEPLTRLDDVRVVLVGDGPRRDRLQKLLPGATFLGFRSGDDLGRAVASLDVLVHTGADETFCQAIQEGMAAGVPVVAPASGGPMDLVRHNETGFLYPADDHDALRCAVEELRDDPLRRMAMGRRARNVVLGRSWSAVGDELLRHYDHVVDRPATAPLRRLVA